MPLLDLNHPTNQYLIAAGFNAAEIQKSPTLVMLLNRFTGTLEVDSTKLPPAGGAATYGNTIHIAKGYKNFLNIAHELAHATGEYQQINHNKNNLAQFESPTDYAMARAKAEGEAIYYEFLVAKELGYSAFKKPVWHHTDVAPTNPDIYQAVDAIASAASSQAEKITALAALNQDMLPSGQLHRPLYTYGEYNTLVFLNNRHASSKIGNDYQQAMGKALDWNTFEAKSLANDNDHYHYHHYGTLGDEVIINAHLGGSVRGQQGQGDLLWGSQGNDILLGNTGKDILLGGAGDDVLVGGAGNDILAGGTGDDLYYFAAGFGQDNIHNQGGGIDNVYFADISLQQLALISQEKNHLTLDIAPKNAASTSKTHDQLIINDFFLGGDAASLNFNFGQGGTLTAAQLLAGDIAQEQNIATQPLIPPLSEDEALKAAQYQQALQQNLKRLHQQLAPFSRTSTAEP